MSGKPAKRKSANPQKAKPPSKKLKAGIASLEEWSSKDPFIEVFNQLIISNYKDRTIAQKRTAKAAQDLLKANDLKNFRKKYANIVTLAKKKTGKKQAKRDEKTRIETEETDKKVRAVERVVFKPTLKTRKQDTEAPSYEVEFKRDYTNFNEAWDNGKKLLIKMIEKHMEQKPNIKLKLGFTYTVVKIVIDADNEDPLTVVGNEQEPLKGICSTTNVSIYNIASVKPSINDLKGQLEFSFQKSLETISGSSWSLKRFDTIFATTHSLDAGRKKKGGSYLPTPTQLAHSKCGLINIQNHDQECFKWCMKYHQTGQTKNDHRLTILQKMEDKYDWTDITFPISFDQITTFENNNKVTMNIWEIAEDGKTYLTKQGNVLHCQTGMVNLLLVENEEGQAHYIYIYIYQEARQDASYGHLQILQGWEILPLLHENC